MPNPDLIFSDIIEWNLQFIWFLALFHSWENRYREVRLIACGLISSKREAVWRGEVKESFPESTLLACEFLFPSGRVLGEHRLHGEGSDGPCLHSGSPRAVCSMLRGQEWTRLWTSTQPAVAGAPRPDAHHLLWILGAPNISSLLLNIGSRSL